MQLVRVVSFDDVDKDRIGQMQQQLDNGLLGDVGATELVMLFDEDTQKSVVLLFFETEAEYDRADQALGAMSADETPGRRASVERFRVAARAAA